MNGLENLIVVLEILVNEETKIVEELMARRQTLERGTVEWGAIDNQYAAACGQENGLYRALQLAKHELRRQRAMNEPAGLWGSRAALVEQLVNEDAGGEQPPASGGN